MESKNREIWLEKYRPESLEQIKGHEDIIRSLEQYVETGELPNLLFAGPPGVGKTASAVAIARELFGDSWEDNFLELNASDDRGINVVRDEVKSFSRAATSDADFRIIFLDEADSLTSDAQAALRRTMEKFSGNVRFILSCNYSSQIIEPIQSRCTLYRFTPLNDKAVREQILEISDEESLEITESAVEALVYAAKGDMRVAVNGLKAVSIIDGTVDEDRVYSLTNTVRPEEIHEIVNYTLDSDFLRARRKSRDIMNENGVSASELIDQIYRFIWDTDEVSPSVATQVTNILSEVDYRITQGANAELQIDSLLADMSEIDN